MKPFVLMGLLALGVIFYFKACVKSGPIEGFSEPVTKMEEGKKSAEAKAATADMQEYQNAVDRFRATEDRFPYSFQELKDKNYIESVPGDLNYDPATGVVSRK